jgi:(2S)-methylsuccinyl-CoA dehydrogenase
MAGGTEEQKQEWLPKLATTEVMNAVAVTEPDFGSDVAGVTVTATPTEGGWLHQRRQDLVHPRSPRRRAVAAGPHRPRPSLGHRACPCSSCPSRAARQPRLRTDPARRDGLPAAARWRAAPIDTIGYRGMHSYEMAFDNWFVPAEQPDRSRWRLGRASTTRWPVRERPPPDRSTCARA